MATENCVRTGCTCGPWWGVNPPPPCPVHTPVPVCPYANRCPSCGSVGAHFCPGPPHPHPGHYYSPSPYPTWVYSTTSNRLTVSRDTHTATG